MATQDLTLWTEVDGGGNLTVTAPKADVVTQSNNVDNYVYDDRGAGYYSGDFDHDFELYVSAASGTNTTFYSYCIADGLASLGNTVPRFLTYIESGSLTPYLADANTAWDAWAAGSNLALATQYYCSLARVGNTLTWDIYSDAARTTLVQSISITIVNTAQTFRYSYAMSSNNWGDAATASYYVQNIDYKEAVAVTGTLNNTLGSATLAGSGAITVKGSLTQTLAGLAITGTGSVSSVSGSLNNTLENATLSGLGTLKVSGQLNSALSNISLAGSGNIAATVGNASMTLDNIGVIGAGKITVKGTLNQTLDNVTLKGGNIISAGMSPASRWWNSI